jgi:putative membrane protein
MQAHRVVIEEKDMIGKKIMACAGLAAALFFGINVAFAQMDINQISSTDRQFLQEASLSSVWKVDLGKIALRQAASKDIQDFSSQMIKDQGKIGLDLKALTQRKGIILSGDVDVVRRNTSAFLSQEYGAAFDRNYISLMMDEHQRDIALYREETEKGKDVDIRAFARRIVGKLEEYAGRAKKILQELPKPLLK